MEPQLNTTAWAETYLHVKFHFDACNRLATIHQRYTDRTGQTDGGPKTLSGRTPVWGIMDVVHLSLIHI